MTDPTRPEWLRPKDVTKFFGIGRTKIYELISDGKVKSVSLRKRGQKRGCRLVSYDSLSTYLESMASGGEALGLNAKDFDTTPSNGEGLPSGRA
jgi:Helix-turn-helix domain